MGETDIEWTRGDDGAPGKVWNPTRGCSRISPGCEHCYAEVMAARFSDPGYWGHGFAVRGEHGGRWTRRLALVTDAAFDGRGKLGLPLSWRKPARCFVNSTSDLFHEELSYNEIAAVFGVMAACPHITFQVLTKRARHMREWFEWIACQGKTLPTLIGETTPPATSTEGSACVIMAGEGVLGARRFIEACEQAPWPLPNVWLGVSVESQEYADERIPELLQTPAAVRFVSYEPALGPVDFNRAAWGEGKARPSLEVQARMVDPLGASDSWSSGFTPLRALDWVIFGSESGPGRRPCDPAWGRAAADACKDAGVAFFTKQIDTEAGRAAGVPKGGDPAYWPPGEWPREFPRRVA